MKLPCKVVEDLLPLYHDNVCSAESRALVEEHLKECEPCKTRLSKIDEELEYTQTTAEETGPLKAIQTAWKKSKKKAYIKGTLIAVIICTVLVGVFVLVLTQWKIVPVSPEVLETSEVSELADGRIVFHLYVNDNKNLYFVKFTTNKDGSCYITPMHSVIEGKRTGDLGLFNHYYDIDITKLYESQQNLGDGITITSVYLGPVGDGILIWKEGMELPAASEELERKMLGE